MSKRRNNVQKAKGTAAIEAALADTRADIAAGRVVKEQAEAHVKRVMECALANAGGEKGNILRGPPEGDWEALA